MAHGIAATRGVQTSTLPGIAMFSFALLLFPTMDAIAKILVHEVSPYEIALMRFGVQTLFLVAVHVALGRPLLVAIPLRTVLFLAGGGIMLAATMALFVWALAYLPLANALAIFFVQPLIVTLLSAVVLRERVGWHRLAAVAVGFAGTLLVIRPNLLAFGWAAVLPAGAALAGATLLIVTRVTTAGLDALRVQFVSGAFAVLWTALALAVGTAAGVPLLTMHGVDADRIWHVIALGAIATVCQGLIVQAVKRTPTNVLAPFQYLEMVSAMVVGFLVFGDFPDALTIAGTAVILASGMYVFHREHRIARRLKLAAADTASIPAP